MIPFFEEIIPQVPPLQMIGALFLDPMDLYRFAQTRVTPILYSQVFRGEIERISSNRARWAVRVASPYRASEALWYGHLGFAYPLLIGCEKAQVKADISEREAILLIDLPPRRKASSRGQRIAESLFGRLRDWLRGSRGLDDFDDALVMDVTEAVAIDRIRDAGYGMLSREGLDEIAECLDNAAIDSCILRRSCWSSGPPLNLRAM